MVGQDEVVVTATEGEEEVGQTPVKVENIQGKGVMATSLAKRMESLQQTVRAGVSCRREVSQKHDQAEMQLKMMILSSVRFAHRQ